MSIQCKAHILRDVSPDAGPRESDEFGAEGVEEEVHSRLVQFTCLLWHPQQQILYCGITAYDADIFYQFDPASGQFTSLQWPRYGEKYDVKIHRSLEMDEHGVIYGATACLHDVALRLDAPGGKLFSYDTRSGEMKVLGIPRRYDYIQTITLDPQRRLIYGQTYPVFNFFKYDLQTGGVTDFDYIGSITHVSCLDDRGRLWGTWHSSAHNLFCYDPDADEMIRFHHSIPNGPAGAGMMYQNAGPVDCMINGGDGYIYIGSTLGELIRLDPETAECTYLGKPYESTRMPGLVVGPGDLLYGSGGDSFSGRLFSYDRRIGAFRDLGRLYDPDLDVYCYRTHDVVMVAEDRFFVAETDTPKRSGYLWEVKLTG